MRNSRAVHDDLGQRLTGLKMDLRAIERGLEKCSDPRLNDILDRTVAATALVDDTVKTVQGIAAELRPALLDQVGLFSALRHEGSEFERRAGPECRVLTPAPEPHLPEQLATACYRIVQESLANVARHAAATAVEIEFQTLRNEFVLEIRDNGRGIAPDAVKNMYSLGLLGMRERGRGLGGEVTIDPRVEGGTVVRARFPLQS